MVLFIARREPCLDAVAHGGNPQDRAASLQNVLNGVFFWRPFLRSITRSDILRIVFWVRAEVVRHSKKNVLRFTTIIITIIFYFIKEFYIFLRGLLI
ncbi:hypothetical protein BJP37_16035 [Moorena bouillonii PNG]|uniref:Uncharacterized protein n=1 Tax=Moorena bouillonii PNG TaxID=568701 RepID=A0A1U7N327_9CYAN|nr:hypothetical protein BJP37_16035 [Moorena bouillonii PNG]